MGDDGIKNLLFNPSFCQELVKRRSRQTTPVFPPGFDEIPVGVQRGPRWGSTRVSLGFNEGLVGVQRQLLVNQTAATALTKEAGGHRKRRFV